MTKNQKIWVAIGLSLVIVLIGWRAYRTSKPRDTVKVGAIFMLTGVGSDWGENSQKGAMLAAEEINNSGGIDGKQLQMVYEDNMGDNPTAAINAFHKLSDVDGIKIILGPNWTPSGLALAPLACQNKVLMISPTLGVKDFNEMCDYLFNLWPHDDLISKGLGGWLYNAKGYRNIAILGSNQEWENAQAAAVKNGFEGAGGKVVDYEISQKGQQDFKAEILRIKQSNPDAVVFTNFTYENISAVELRDIDPKVPLFSVLLDNEHIQAAHGALEGAIAVTSFTPSSGFSAKFLMQNNRPPDIGSDTSYDALMLLAQAMKATHSENPETVKGYLTSLRDYQGVSGNLIFDGKRGITKEPKFMIVKNGQLTSL